VRELGFFTFSVAITRLKTNPQITKRGNVMTSNSKQNKWTQAQIDEHLKKIQAVIEEHKRHIKKGEGFTSYAPT